MASRLARLYPYSNWLLGGALGSFVALTVLSYYAATASNCAGSTCSTPGLGHPTIDPALIPAAICVVLAALYLLSIWSARNAVADDIADSHEPA